MRESFTRVIGGAAEKVKNFALARLAKNIEEEARAGKFKELGNRMLKMFGIKPAYSAEGRAGFEAMRKKLGTEAGIIIANHPGYIDPFLIFPLLDRSDVLVMAHDNLYVPLEKQLGREATEKHFISSSTKIENLRKILPRIEEHIKNGGVFLIFPTGMMRDVFQSTFRHVIENMDGNDMVYSFQINTDDVGKFQKDYKRFAGFASSVLPTPEFLEGLQGINDYDSPLEVRVDENYSKVKEWQAVAEKDSSSKKTNVALTDHFNNQFDNQSDDNIEAIAA